MLNILIEMFDWVGIHTNMGKAASMACQTCCAIEAHSMEANVPRITGEGLSHWNIPYQRVSCPEYDAEFVAGYLATYW